MVTFIDDSTTENDDTSNNLVKLQNLTRNNTTTNKNLDTLSVNSDSSTNSTDSENLDVDGILISPSQLPLTTSGVNIVNSNDVHLGDVVHNHGPIINIHKKLTIKDLEENTSDTSPKYSITDNHEHNNCDNSLGNINSTFIPEDNCDNQIKTAKLDDGLFIVTNKNIENCSLNTLLVKKKSQNSKKLLLASSLVLILGAIVVIFMIKINTNSFGSIPTNNDTNTDIEKLGIIPRLNWSRQLVNDECPNFNLPLKLVIISHTELSNCSTYVECVEQCLIVLHMHTVTNRWLDIGYNFLIGGDGSIYEGRGFYKEGSHTRYYNKKSLGIAFIGNFEEIEAPPEQLEAAEYLLNITADMRILTEDYKVLGALQVRPTASPENGKLRSILLLASPFTLILLICILIGGIFLFKNISNHSVLRWKSDTNEQEKSTPIDGTNNTIAGPKKLRIVPRLEWLAQPPTQKPDDLILPIPMIIIMHTATVNCSTRAQCVFQCRQIQTFHMESKNWWDIGYNFLVGGDGLVYEGRGFYQEGAHTFSYNSKSLGIAFIGTFEQYKPPEIQLIAGRKLIKKAEELNILTPNYKIIGARDVDGTLSPGQKLYDEIQTWPHYSNNITLH